MSKTTKRELKGDKIDLVFIRKSTCEQDESGQIANVEVMLKNKGVDVPKDNWFLGTVSRRKVKANAEFVRLMELVESDRVRTVYVESQDRWGTKDRPELFSLLGTLREHGTKLFDLRDNKDLTERDLATELLAFVGSIKSEKELKDLSYRSLRTRVNQFLATGSWPTGTHPYGFGKRCTTADGVLKWEWHPINRKFGQIFYPDLDGCLTPGPAKVMILRKDRRDIIKLVPNRNADYVHAVQLVFDLYTRVGLSRRKIALRLNAEGLLFNCGPFGHTNITDILRNPAYAGDTVFGKWQTGELHTFDEKGLIVEVKELPDGRRDVSKCLVRRDTHEPLVDRKTWELAARKLVTEQKRTSYAPRNPAYFLKQIFVCGHCGKSMAARTETNPDNGRRTVVYVCSCYLKGRQDGRRVECGYHRLTHDEAERLLLDKVKELSLPFDESVSKSARENLLEQLTRLDNDGEESRDRWWSWLVEGVACVVAYLKGQYSLKGWALEIIEGAAADFYRLNGKVSCRYRDRLPITLAEFKRAVREAERVCVGEAVQEVKCLRDEHEALTLNWAKATSEMQAVLKREIERLESDIRNLESRTIPITERFKQLYDAEANRDAERKQLLGQWRTLGDREKGEALRRLFGTVTLYWDATFHPSEKNPSRPRKTNRSGRYRYSLRRDLIEWSIATTDSVTSW